jgi:hypothetical protein
MKMQGVKRITVEEFKDSEKDLVGKLSFILNNFMEQVTNVLNKNVDFDNLNREVINFNTVVTTGGVPKNPLQIRISLKTKLKGFNVIKTDNLQDNTPLSGAPFLAYSINGDLVTVTQVLGLPVDKKFSITVEAIG